MKSLLFLSACGLVLTGLGACAPMAPPTARVALDCPSDVGALKLSTMSPDKKTCLYSNRDGDQVSLRLIAVSGSAYDAALQPVETELQGEVQTPAEAKAGAVSDGKSTVVSAKAAASTASDASAVAKQAAEDAKGSLRADKDKDKEEDGDARDADDSSSHHGGDHAHIDLPGIHINADDDSSTANIRVSGVNIDASDNGATIRMVRDVRLRGEAFSRDKRGFRATFILARDDLKDGWKAVGYEAAGPKAGPITVAVFKAHEGGHHDVSDDIKRLVRRNGGV
jgi:hypothetical protein